MTDAPLQALAGKLVVSCQARPDNPLHGPGFMAAMARAAEQGGAGGIRANGVADIVAIRALCRLPIIGLNKRFHESFEVYITPSIADGCAVAEAGADLIAVDATQRPRDGEALADLIAGIRARTGKPVLADVATVEDAMTAIRLGADAVATTLAGYTPETRVPSRSPDLALLHALVESCSVPVIAEGRFADPADVRAAFGYGAHAVVVGTAITNPREITRRFVGATPSGSPS